MRINLKRLALFAVVAAVGFALAFGVSACGGYGGGGGKNKTSTSKGGSGY